MLESRWPKGPLLLLIGVVLGLILINPFVHRSSSPTSRAAATPAGVAHHSPHRVQPSFPAARQGGYTVQQIQLLAGRYLHRAAGGDTGLPPRVNGHDEFAAAWLETARRNLRGLPVGVFSQRFPLPGFTSSLPRRQGRNILVIVPGTRYPKQAVVIGAHYDGEPFSYGSAYDDTSGCAILLALMRTLGAEWRRQGLPSRTVEFVLFDGEEQWVVGSGAYLYDLRHGALMPKPIMMIDEEQSGVGYPARPFGLASRLPMPAFAVTTAEQAYYENLFGNPIQGKTADLQTMTDRLIAARADGFRALNHVYPRLHLRGGTIRPFRPRNVSQVHIGANGFCCSDNGAFEVLGLPTFTYVGDYQYYKQGHPDWSYPYDQPQDTLAGMACDTSGHREPSSILNAALAIPAVLSARLVNDYAKAGPGQAKPVIISMPAIAGHQTPFLVTGPKNAKWSFGDGTQAVGQSLRHEYRHRGSFTIRLQGSGQSVEARITVNASLSGPHFWSHVPSPPAIIPWHPPEVRGVKGCD